MKTCRGCNQPKPLDEFYQHPQMGDGRLNFCKTCVCEKVRSHRIRNESVRIYDRERSKTPERKRHLKRITREWNEKNPDGYKAHYLISNAVRDGRIIKKPCASCGSMKRIHAHHHDYSKPLDVTWLCARCHAAVHAAERMS
jgi:hypothetical protein